jgi:hypothetical protein
VPVGSGSLRMSGSLMWAVNDKPACG